VSSSRSLKFGEFRLDPVSGQLYRGATPVPLTPKAFALLHHLARDAGRLVSKQELLDTVWSGVYVGDAVLKTTIREIRRALDDHPDTPRFIETAHRRGYRFTASVASEGAVALRSTAAPRVRYAHSGTVNIAYQVTGDGPRDVVFVMGWVSHLEYFWNEPSFARFLNRLASNGRLILFDKRGTGMSDPVPISELPTLEQRLDDVRAVMEAAGSERAVLVGVSEGGPLCSLFAATYPDRTEALVMIDSGFATRAGVHIGERHLTDDRDPIVEISARLAEAAPAGEVYVSRTVMDLVPGSGLRFDDRGVLITPALPVAVPMLAVAPASIVSAT
jgi:DNA-binding winged helix-turn-helix (wHTH) protein